MDTKPRLTPVELHVWWMLLEAYVLAYTGMRAGELYALE